MDSSFFTKYEDYLDNIENPEDQVKDFFEPGVPAELVRASRKTSTSTTRFVFTLNRHFYFFVNLTDVIESRVIYLWVIVNYSGVARSVVYLSLLDQEPLKLSTELYSELSPNGGLELVFLLQ